MLKLRTLFKNKPYIKSDNTLLKVWTISKKPYDRLLNIHTNQLEFQKYGKYTRTNLVCFIEKFYYRYTVQGGPNKSL